MSSTSDQSDGENKRPAMRWDDSNMASSFANVVNVQSTREQVDVFFGVNQSWNMREDPTLVVDLTHRIMMTPLAAKRLSMLLGSVLREYESRHGTLDTDKQT